MTDHIPSVLEGNQKENIHGFSNLIFRETEWMKCDIAMKCDIVDSLNLWAVAM